MRWSFFMGKLLSVWIVKESLMGGSRARRVHIEPPKRHMEPQAYSTPKGVYRQKTIRRYVPKGQPFGTRYMPYGIRYVLADSICASREFNSWERGTAPPARVCRSGAYRRRQRPRGRRRKEALRVSIFDQNGEIRRISSSTRP